MAAHRERRRCRAGGGGGSARRDRNVDRHRRRPPPLADGGVLSCPDGCRRLPVHRVVAPLNVGVRPQEHQPSQEQSKENRPERRTPSSSGTISTAAATGDDCPANRWERAQDRLLRSVQRVRRPIRAFGSFRCNTQDIAPRTRHSTAAGTPLAPSSTLNSGGFQYPRYVPLKTTPSRTAPAPATALVTRSLTATPLDGP